MDSPNEITRKTTWSKPPMIKSPILRWTVIIGVSIYLLISIRTFEINVSRVISGMDRAVLMMGSFFRPDFISRQSLIIEGVIESITMTIVASVIGVIISIPFCLGAAKNISSKPVYYFSRFMLAGFRSLHVVILAIFFVILFGFGPLAGVMTMTVNSIGFLGKITAEEIENIREEALDAVRSTGASWFQLISYGVWPQIKTRFIGLSIYRSDMTFRQSTIVGLVGAGGIGTILETAMGRYDFNTAGAILVVIIILVLIGEYASSAVRRRLT